MTMILSVLRDTWSLLFSSLTAGDRRRSEIVVSLLAQTLYFRLPRTAAVESQLAIVLSVTIHNHRRSR